MEAVRPGGQVWLNRDGKLDVIEVSLAHVEGETALIRSAGSGIAAGDLVIVSPLVSVVEGMSLKEDGEKTVAAPATTPEQKQPEVEASK